MEQTKSLQELVDEITAFDNECQEGEHTDVGEAWDLLHRIRTTVVQVLAEANPPSDI